MAKKNTNILLAEDNRLMTMLITKLISHIGDFKVTKVDNGVAALKASMMCNFDYVITDSEMPQICGITLVKKLRSNPRFSHTPVLMLTGHEDPKHRATAFAAGVNAYQVKTDNIQELQQVISQFLL